MKAGVAAALVACREAAAWGCAGDVVVAAVADEEHASLGVREALESLSADAAIVTEPTEMELAVAHKGFVWLEIEVTGQAAHGSRPAPRRGRDREERPDSRRHRASSTSALGEREHPLLGAGSVHASLIEGGVELSTYPGPLHDRAGAAHAAGGDGGDVEGEMAELLAAARGDPELVAESRTLLVREPFEIAPDAEIVGIVRDGRRGVGSAAGRRRELLGRLGLHRRRGHPDRAVRSRAARARMPSRSG